MPFRQTVESRMCTNVESNQRLFLQQRPIIHGGQIPSRYLIREWPRHCHDIHDCASVILVNTQTFAQNPNTLLDQLIHSPTAIGIPSYPSLGIRREIHNVELYDSVMMWRQGGFLSIPLGKKAFPHFVELVSVHIRKDEMNYKMDYEEHDSEEEDN
ncbi:hypothetical protein YC2023_034699 [Brassica napus]